jgi:hypothetical protein
MGCQNDADKEFSYLLSVYNSILCSLGYMWVEYLYGLRLFYVHIYN